MIFYTLNLAVTWALTGLIWVVQLVSYPAFERVGRDTFPDYHAHHTRSITLIVLPLMVTELGLAGWLCWGTGASMTCWVPMALLAGIWISTFMVQIPLHFKLAKGKDEWVIRRLIRSNWIRTILWTLKGLWLWELVYE